MAARHSYGLSWHFLTIAAEAALLIAAAVITYRQRRELLPRVRRLRFMWPATTAVATVAVIAGVVGADGVAHGLAQSAISVGGCMALVLLAARSRSENSNSPAAQPDCADYGKVVVAPSAPASGLRKSV